MDYEQLGCKIREERTKRRLTQEQLAELADVTSSYVGQIERSERRPSLQKVEKLAEVMDISVDYLISFKPTKEAKEIDDKVNNMVNSLSQEEKYMVMDIVKVIKRYSLK